MSYNISTTDRFEKDIKKLFKKFPSLKGEYAGLVNALKQDPFLGTPIGNDCYKIRLSIASKGRGKSGGARVVTHVHISGEKVYLLTIYDKAEQDAISDKDILGLISSIRT